ESYREELWSMIRSSGIESNVVMVDRYLEENELIQMLTACDIYVTPYPGMEQITSGTLAYAVGLGRPVLTTPYSYAQDLLADEPELLIPYEDRELWRERMLELLRNEVKLQAVARRIEKIGETM